MILHSAFWFPASHPFIRSYWSSQVIFLNGIIFKCIPGSFCCKSHIWPINIFVSLQFEGSYFPLQSFFGAASFSQAVTITSSHFFWWSPVPLRTRVTVVKPSLSVGSPPPLGSSEYWHTSSKCFTFSELSTLKSCILKWSNGWRVEKLV